MINIIKSNNNLTLRYSTENTWVSDQLNIREDFSINKRNFIFLKRDILSINNTDGDLVDFSFGELNDAGYFYIKGRKLGIENDVYIHKSIDISEKIFIGVNNNSIFKAINKVVTQDIYIGGDQTDAIPVKDFFLLLKGFPNQYEVSKYIKDRLSAVLENYFDSAYLIRGKYESYMNKRNSIKGENLEQALKESEIIKYELIVEKLNLMLRNENKYNEKQWQIEILRIILLLYPKYIYAFDEAPVRDAYNSKKDKRIDFILIDSDGNVDIIEIKRPMNEKIITKTIHRGNYIPRQDLSSTVMQVEKYIYHLNKSGRSGEERLTNKYKSKISSGFNIKITNPGGIIIMGRDTDLSIEQKQDFEIIKRKYNNVIDIITYDDLLRRLNFIIAAWKSKF